MLHPIGSLVGPLVSGFLTIRFSYVVMYLVMGEFICPACPQFEPVASCLEQESLTRAIASLTFVCFILAIFFVGFREEGL